MKVLVLAGGTSDEREVSFRSGINVARGLKRANHQVLTADPAAEVFNLNGLVAAVDIVMPILHGASGEDGSIQAELEAAHANYLGSTPEVCRQLFNKVRFKEKIAGQGFLTPNWQVVNRQSFQGSALSHKSFVLKPIEGGSSIDTHIVHNPAHQLLDLDQLFAGYDDMLLEELIEGQEITVGILGQTALPVILIIPPAGEDFDYRNKYNGRSQEIVSPKQVPIELQEQAQKVCLDIHQLFGCRHLSRTDIILSPEGSLYVLEANSIPGLTEQSLYPKAANASGLSMEKLVDRFISLVKA